VCSKINARYIFVCIFFQICQNLNQTSNFHEVMRQHTEGMMWSIIWILLEIYFSFQRWKNFENPLRIDKLIAITNHRSSVVWHCCLGHLTREIISEMTYNVSSGTLNSTIPYLLPWLWCTTYLGHSVYMFIRFFGRKKHEEIEKLYKQVGNNVTTSTLIVCLGKMLCRPRKPVKL